MHIHLTSRWFAPARCRASQLLARAMAMGRPIIASQPTKHPVQRTKRLHPARSEHSNAAQVATNELR